MHVVTINSYFYVHSGGTKYYHLYLIATTDAEGKSHDFIFTNYGKYDSGKTHLPRDSGTSSVVEYPRHVIVGILQKMQKVREKRGYVVDIGRSVNAEHNCETTDGVGRVFIAWGLTSPHVTEMMEMIMSGDSKVVSSVADEMRKPEPEPVIERGVEWGSW